MTRYVRWPIETSLSLEALPLLEQAICEYLEEQPQGRFTMAPCIELLNVANLIRSYLQKVNDGTFQTSAEVDPLLT